MQRTDHGTSQRNPLDRAQHRLLLLEEFLQWRNLLLDHYPVDPSAVSTAKRSVSRSAHSGDGDLPRDAGNPTGAADAADVIRILQRALLRHPGALQAAFNALVREGQRFATTEDGRRWQERIEGSEALEQLRLLWEATSLTVVAESDGPLPSALLELFVGAAKTPELESIATRLGMPFLGDRAAEHSEDPTDPSPA